MQKYSHSGAVPPLGALYTLITGVSAALFAGILYGYAFFYIPILYLKVLLTVAFGAGLGYVVAYAAQFGKIRNNWFVFAVSILTAALGLYFYWGAYFWALVGFSNVPKLGLHAFTPAGLQGLGEHLFQNGSWSFTEGNPVKGWFLATLWVIEGAVVIGLAAIVSLVNSERPFCERCREWTISQYGVARLWARGDEPAWEKVLAGEMPALAEFPPAPPGADYYVRLDLARCPKCAENCFLSIAAIARSLDKNGKVVETPRTMLTNGAVSPAQCAVVEACGQLYEQSLEECLAGDPEPEDALDDSAGTGGQAASTEGEPR